MRWRVTACASPAPIRRLRAALRRAPDSSRHVALGHGLLGYGKVAEHYPFEMPQLLRDAGYWTLGIGKMHWTPQNATHGFHATLIDESGRRESPYFMSDYRKWFACHAPGLDPDATGIGWNAHRAAAYALPEELHPTCWTGGRPWRPSRASAPANPSS